MLSETEIHGIVDRIVRNCDPEVVGLFGSYAIGTATDRSDLDVFVIQRTGERRSERVRRLQGLLLGILHPVDVQVFTPEEFEAESQEEHSFTYTVARQAKILYRKEAP